jgi:hypothetical protein
VADLGVEKRPKRGILLDSAGKETQPRCTTMFAEANVLEPFWTRLSSFAFMGKRDLATWCDGPWWRPFIARRNGIIDVPWWPPLGKPVSLPVLFQDLFSQGYFSLSSIRSPFLFPLSSLFPAHS